MNNHLPKDWKVDSLDSLVKYHQQGYYTKTKYGEAGVPLLRISDINDDCEIKYDTIPKLEAPAKDVRRFKLQRGDLIIARSGTIGRCAVFEREDLTCLFGAYLIRFRFKPDINSHYVKFFIMSDYGRQQLETKSHKAAHTDINAQEIKSIEIPVPPSKAMDKIVQILQKAMNLKKLREQANQMTNGVIQTVFEKIFGDKFTREPIGKHTIKTEVRDPRKKPNEYFQYIDIAGIDNKTGKIAEVKTILGKEAPSRARKVVRKDDIIVSTVRPNLNATALVPPELDNQICSTGFCVLRCKSSLNPRYLYAFTRRREFINTLSSQMKGAAYPAVTNNDVLNFEIPIPPTELQNNFASIVERVETLRDRQNQSTLEITELFNSLIQRAFRGKLVV